MSKPNFLESDDYAYYLSLIFQMLTLKEDSLKMMDAVVNLDVLNMALKALGSPIQPAVLNKYKKALEESASKRADSDTPIEIGFNLQQFLEIWCKHFKVADPKADLDKTMELASENAMITKKSLKAIRDKYKMDYDDNDIDLIFEFLDKKGTGSVPISEVMSMFSTNPVDMLDVFR